MGVEVTGNADQAFWKSSQVISALVITAGGVTYNIALDFPETVGSVSPDNYSVFGGAPMDALAFCVGEKTRPDTTTSGPSVELSKTAECATVGDDGMATVTGTITADLDSHRPARITSALDTILAPGDIALHMETVGLVGEVLTVDDDVVTITYAISFDPGSVTSFDNFVEVTLEDAETGEDRHKIYNARAAFELCDEGEAPLGSITIIKDANPDTDQAFAFTTSGTGLSDFALDGDGDATVPSEWTFADLEAGTYTVTETEVDGWTLTSITCSTGGTGDADSATATITLEAGAHVTCTFLNTQEGEGVSPGNPPGEGTQGGNPVPDTALAPITASPMTAVLALLALMTLGAVGALTAVQVRSRR